jgi:AcrR family transcriptional regulator
VATTSGTTPDRKDFAARDRLLLAATQLLDEAAGGPVSTREITERAGVRAPTLYHHFGSKQALLDAVVSHGFKEFLRSRRAGSDATTRSRTFAQAGTATSPSGSSFPAPTRTSTATSSPACPAGSPRTCAHICLEALQPAAIQGRLLVSPAEAATRILAACSGVTLT